MPVYQAWWLRTNDVIELCSGLKSIDSATHHLFYQRVFSTVKSEIHKQLLERGCVCVAPSCMSCPNNTNQANSTLQSNFIFHHYHHHSVDAHNRENVLKWSSGQLQCFLIQLGGIQQLDPQDRRMFSAIKKRITNREYAKRSRDERRYNHSLLLAKIENLELLNEALRREIVHMREVNHTLSNGSPPLFTE